jgi:hypothetical protein
VLPPGEGRGEAPLPEVHVPPPPAHRLLRRAGLLGAAAGGGRRDAPRPLPPGRRRDRAVAFRPLSAAPAHRPWRRPRTLTITKTPSGAWRACVGFRHVRARRLEPSVDIGAVDRGITVTAALADASLLVMPGFVGDARDTIARLGRERATHESNAAEWQRANRAIANAYRSAHHQSENWARHTARDIAALYGVIAVEHLDLVTMTTSAEGTVTRPRRRVSQKQGLNRRLHDAVGRPAFWIRASGGCWAQGVEGGPAALLTTGRGVRAHGQRQPQGHAVLLHRLGAPGPRRHQRRPGAHRRAQAAAARWRELGGPADRRPKPGLQRRKGDAEDEGEVATREVLQLGAGPAPHAVTASSPTARVILRQALRRRRSG